MACCASQIMQYYSSPGLSTAPADFSRSGLTSDSRIAVPLSSRHSSFPINPNRGPKAHRVSRKRAKSTGIKPKGASVRKTKKLPTKRLNKRKSTPFTGSKQRFRSVKKGGRRSAKKTSPAKVSSKQKRSYKRSSPTKKKRENF